MATTPTNAYGEPIDPADPDPTYQVPPQERQDTDDGPGSDAREGGDDMEGWQPE